MGIPYNSESLAYCGRRHDKCGENIVAKDRMRLPCILNPTRCYELYINVREAGGMILSSVTAVRSYAFERKREHSGAGCEWRSEWLLIYLMLAYVCLPPVCTYCRGFLTQLGILWSLIKKGFVSLNDSLRQPDVDSGHEADGFASFVEP